MGDAWRRDRLGSKKLLCDRRLERSRECRGRDVEGRGWPRLGASLPRVNGKCEVQNWRANGI